MGSRIGCWALAIACLLVSAIAAGAAPPQDATYQGLLLDSVGDPVAGPVNIEVGVWDSLVGGTQLYGETHSGVALADGVFNLLLGTGSGVVGSFDADLFAAQNRYLEVTVDVEVLVPRQPFTSVAYALQSEESEEAAYAATAGDADTVDGSHAAALDQSAHVSDTGNPHGVTAAQVGAVTSSQLASHTADASAHHPRYSDGEAVAAIKAADGPGSGLNADLLDGVNSSTFATEAEVMPLVLAGDGPGSSLNADYLDGASSTSFLRSNTSDQYTAGTLTLNPGTTLAANGTLSVGLDSGSDDDAIAFDAGAESFTWDESETRFAVSDELAIAGPLRAGNTTGTPQGFSSFTNVSNPESSTDSGDMSNAGDLFVVNDVEVGGQLYLSRDLYMEGNAGSGADGDQSIHFYNSNSRESEHIAWNDFEGLFDLSAPTRVQGSLRVEGDLIVPPETIEKEDLAPSAATLLPVAFGHVESPHDSSSYSFHTTGTTVLGFDGHILEIEPPTGCDATGDCIIMVSQAQTFWEQVAQATDQVSSHGRFAIVIRGISGGDTIDIPENGPFSVNFLIYKFP